MAETLCLTPEELDQIVPDQDDLFFTCGGGEGVVDAPACEPSQCPTPWLIHVSAVLLTVKNTLINRIE